MIGTGRFSYISDPNKKQNFESKLNAAVKRFYGFQRPLKQVPVKNLQKFNKTKSWENNPNPSKTTTNTMSSRSNCKITRSKSFNIKSISSKSIIKDKCKNNNVVNQQSFSSKNKTHTKSILKTSKSHRDINNLEHERLTVGPFRLPSSRTTSYRAYAFDLIFLLLFLLNT